MLCDILPSTVKQKEEVGRQEEVTLPLHCSDYNNMFQIRLYVVTSPQDLVTPRDTMAEDTESLRLEMLDEASLTRQPDEVNTELPSCSFIQTSMSL